MVNGFKMAQTQAIGIDLGTSSCVIAVYRNGSYEVIPNKNGESSTPSVVFYDPVSFAALVGTVAVHCDTKNSDNRLFDIKRIIGRTYEDVYVQQLINSPEYPYKIVRGDNGAAEIELEHNGESVRITLIRVVSDILKYLKDSATEYLKSDVTEAVISVPASFSNAQRKATLTAAEAAGLKVLRLISEPLATAVYYAEDKYSTAASPQSYNVLVFDFGAGTFDVSIIEISGTSFCVKCVEGDCFLGGRDFDRILVNAAKSGFTTHFTRPDKIVREIDEACVHLKHALSQNQFHSIHVNIITEDPDSSIIRMDREKFEELTEHLFARAEKLMQKCLDEAHMTKDDIRDVILVGGTTRIPKIRNMLTSFFGKSKIRTALNLEAAVAFGASIQAGVVQKCAIKFATYQLTEVSPFSLGLGAVGDLTETFIVKNSPFPVRSPGNLIQTILTKEKSCRLRIFEGQRTDCRFNNLLAEFKVSELPGATAQDVVAFQVVFSINNNGILEIEAHEMPTEQHYKLNVSIGEFQLCSFEVSHAIKSEGEIKALDRAFEMCIRLRDRLRNICIEIFQDIMELQSKKESTVDSTCIQDVCDTIELIFENNNSNNCNVQLERFVTACDVFHRLVAQYIENALDENPDIQLH
ncbi:heat shock 70 kDa protein II isoform X1 [Dendroctonus ponderosae]|uniref:heat shock 70 kDa protein II isoform X1 n=2 Tax=Dendroctonus ponderosae TaxID=77166 RepID=UPI002034F4FC|nr:heat shock 70 kDa protein II isoform X1 [Dendroctonus ponderosae]KAH1024011.1 hypothetical protein HUJ05_003578 [Dendroctonus ponderosae]